MGTNEINDFMKPKAVSIKRKVRTTQVLPPKKELIEVKVDKGENVQRTVPVNPFRRPLKRLRGSETESENPEAKKEIKTVQVTVNLPQAPPTLSSETDPDVCVTKAFPSMPIDWCLKTRIRVSSSKQLPWTGILKTTEEASGTTGYVRALYEQTDTSVQAKVHQSCLYWQHPALPWVPLFPRQGQKRFEGTQLVETRFHDSLQQDFRQSFKSLYQLLRARQCAFFYLCSPEFTVLFRATGVCGFSDFHALISPTTKGFRSLLKDKGIDFQMPFCSDEKPENVGERDGQEDTNDDEDFFESLGLTHQDFPMIVASKLQKSAFDTDNGPSSCVVVVGDGAQALFNHLLNTDLSINVGSQAGIPPTLLSPVAFHGATLRSQKVKQTWFRLADSNVRHHAIEIVGPVMPNAVDSLCSLLSGTQAEFTVLSTPTPGSTAFSRTINQKQDSSAAPIAFAVEALKDCGLPKGFIQRICSSGDHHGTLIEADYKDGSFFINTSA